jgi:NADH-quinone oxidoreductase subunit H
MDANLLLLIAISFVKIAAVIGVMLGIVSYTVMAERRISAAIQDRIGPNRTGPWGLLQPIADSLKFMLKEEFTPASVNKFYFWLAPCMAVIPALLTVCVVPFATIQPITIPFWNVELYADTLNFIPTTLTIEKPGVIADLNVGILFVFAIASLGVYGIVLAGWASNSKYPFFGGIRSSAQLISYEIAMGLSVIPLFLIMGTLNLSEIVNYQIQHGWNLVPIPFIFGQHVTWQTGVLLIPVGISFIIFLISSFAETNRLPFDLPESETELVGGYHTEYSAMKFALFFLGEYAAMIVATAMIVTLFLGGWSLPMLPDFVPFASDWNALNIGPAQWWHVLLQAGCFFTKMCTFIVFFIWIRWTLPRLRYDQLMDLGWKFFLPLALANVLLTGVLLMLLPR